MVVGLITVLLQEEAYMPISIQSDREYKNLIVPFGIDRQDLSSDPLILDEVEPVSPSLVRRVSMTEDGVLPAYLSNLDLGLDFYLWKGGATRYPKTFPFSAVVPRLSVEIYRAVLLCFLYGLHLQLPTMEAVILGVSAPAWPGRDIVHRLSQVPLYNRS
jgi:hypothetical protein